MKTRLAAAIALLSVCTLHAQMTCERTDIPAPLRAQSLAELLPDIVLSCTGGVPASPGTAVAQFQVLISANTPFASRVLAPVAGQSWNWTDALLLIDEPQPEQQAVCVQASPSSSCSVIAGSSSASNVFQGELLQTNAISFQGVPIDAPGPGVQRIVRVTNLRVDMTQLPLTPAPPAPVLSVQLFPSTGIAVAIANASQSSGAAQPALVFSVRTANDTPAQTLLPVLAITPAMLPAVTSTTSQFAEIFHVKFTEGFAGSFRRRNTGTSGFNPLYLADQDVPGVDYSTESGFFNSGFPTSNSLSFAGLADCGTRLKLTLQNIPAGVGAWVSIRDVQPGTTNFSIATPRALLEFSDAGTFNPVLTDITDGFYQLTPTEGTALAIWEVVTADPGLAEDYSFAVALTLNPQGTAPTALGVATAAGELGPTDDDRGDLIPPVPHFLASSSPLPAFAIVANTATTSLTTVNAASFGGASVAPGSIASIFGAGLAPYAQAASGAGAQTSLAGTSVDIVDYDGIDLPAALLFVSPAQINFVLDSATNTGPAVITVSNAGQVVASGLVLVSAVAPGLFSASSDGQGLAAGNVQAVNGSSSLVLPMAVYDPNQNQWAPEPISLGSAGTLVYLDFYGTGFRLRSSVSNVLVTLGGISVPTLYAGSQNQFAGLDQLIVGPVPRALAGKGATTVSVNVDGASANILSVVFQ
jgi:uncharacterized protein (TIGR03437 family)